MKDTLIRARQALLSRRATLTRTLRALGASEVERAPGERGDPLGAPAATVLAAREQVELAEIDAALARIEDGTFGACSACGGPIGRDRLRAVPEARLCLRCASRPTASRGGPFA